METDMTRTVHATAAALSLLISLTLCLAAFADATSAAEESSEAPVAVATAEPASQVNPDLVTKRESPPWPASVPRDLPTGVPLAQYLAEKRQLSRGGRRPSAPAPSAPLATTPLATNIFGFNGITEAVAGHRPPDINGA